MSICGQTVSNWLRKGHELLQMLLPSLKSLLLMTKSILHIDETWCRVRIVKEEFKDAYAVYRFFTDLNKENERSLWCAHVRAKFKYASDISKDKDTRIYFGNMMNTALNYMINGWQELLNYRHDGRYNIDNAEAERKIRPFTIGRKNTLFFGSEKGVEVATTYHTIIETCKLNGLSPLDYLTHVFRQLMMGNKDYESLLLDKLVLKTI